MKKIIYSFALLLCIVNCNRPENNSSKDSVSFEMIETITIDADSNTKFQDIIRDDSLFTTNVSFIKLETTDESLIGEITDIFFDDSLIFVVDANNAKSIFIFDFNGKYINKIDAYGGGPGEYATMWNVFIDRKNKRLVVVDTPRKNMLFYSYSGLFIASEKRTFPASNIQFLPSGNRAYHYIENVPELKNGKNVLTVTDQNINPLYSCCTELYNEQFRFNQPKDFWEYDNNLYFYPDYSDTLFLITDSGAFAKYYIDVIPKEKKMPHPADIIDVTSEIFFEDYLLKYPYFNCKFIELKDFTYLELDNPVIQAIYSHRTKKTYHPSGRMRNYIFTFLNICCDTHPITRFASNTLVIPVSAYKLTDSNTKKFNYEMPDFLKKEGCIPIPTEFLDSLYTNLDEEDNPVLFFYEINPNL